MNDGRSGPLPQLRALPATGWSGRTQDASAGLAPWRSDFEASEGSDSSITSLEELVSRFWDPVMRYLWKRLPLEDAEDLAQNVFVAIHRALSRGDGPPGGDADGWRRYLYTAARHQLIDYWRRQGRESPVDSLEEALGAEENAGSVQVGPTVADALESLVSRECGEAIRDCLSTLEVLPRAICLLHFVEGRSKRWIARLLEMPESSLRNLFVCAIRNLRHCLESKGIRELE